VNPKFLAVQLNSGRAKLFFEKHFRGTQKKHITKGDISNLTIMVPDIETQKKAVEAFELLGEERRMLNNLKLQNDSIIENLCVGDYEAADKAIQNREEVLLKEVSSVEVSHMLSAIIKYNLVSESLSENTQIASRKTKLI
jgi:restriction endonuclease S subunit